MKIISYLRVPTARQGRAGLNLDAQRAAIDEYAATKNAHLVKEFVEVESGADNTRPKLAQALRLAASTDATLVIAKLGRLSHNVAFLRSLEKAGVKFIAADRPDVSEATVGITTLTAQQEREAIFIRTKEAFNVAKRCVTDRGKPTETAAPKKAEKGNVAAVSAVKLQANAHAEALKPVLRALADEGLTSPGEIARALTERGILTARGGAWHNSTVLNLLARLNRSEEVQRVD